MHAFKAFVIDHLKSSCQPQEISQITRLLLEKMAGIDKMQYYGGKDIKIPEHIAGKLREAVLRMEENVPLQYILGETEFSGLKFHVRPGVLIPRPETEELVELVIKDVETRHYKNDKIRITDICTGSGCIAVALAKKITGSLVEAWDISSEAIGIAKENAEINSVDVIFRQIDVLDFKPTEDMNETMDILVSNPPYVCRKEQVEMEPKVIQHEPHLALFVEDDNPLVFYNAIAETAIKILKEEGLMYFEINSLLWEKTMELLNSFSFRDVSVLKDISGRERFIRVKK
jgi:release factor glutamine methyltransferase